MIYFFGSISGGTEDIERVYRPLIRHSEQFGQVLSADIFFAPDILEGKENGTSDCAIFQRDVGFIDRANVLIGEVSIPSHGVGWELCYAEQRGIPILALHRPSSGHHLSCMLSGNPYLAICSYESLTGAKGHITRFMRSLRSR